MTTASFERIFIVLLSMMYLPRACSYSWGLSCNAIEDSITKLQVRRHWTSPGSHASICSQAYATGHCARHAYVALPSPCLGSSHKPVSLLGCHQLCQASNNIQAQWARANLKPLFLDARLVQNIHISCHLCQIIHLLPLNASPREELLDVRLHKTSRPPTPAQDGLGTSKSLTRCPTLATSSCCCLLITHTSLPACTHQQPTCKAMSLRSTARHLAECSKHCMSHKAGGQRYQRTCMRTTSGATK